MDTAFLVYQGYTLLYWFVHIDTALVLHLDGVTGTLEILQYPAIMRPWQMGREIIAIRIICGPTTTQEVRRKIG